MSSSASSPLSDDTVRAWLSKASYSKCQHVRLLSSAIWHKWRRNRGISDATIGEAIISLSKWLCYILLVSVPVIIEYIKSTIENKPFTYLGMALVWMGVLAVAQLLIWWAEGKSGSSKNKKAKREHQNKVAHEFQSVVNQITNCTKIIDFKKNPGRQQSITRDILSVIEHEVRIFFEGYGDIHYCASVLRFSDPRFSEMEVYARSDQSRAVGHKVQADSTAAYYAAKFGRHIVIHDIKSNLHPFGQRGISSPETSYRSFLCIPITIARNGAYDCVGVLSIDSQRPYEFAGSGETDVVTMLKPYCALLALVVGSESYALRCQFN